METGAVSAVNRPQGASVRTQPALPPPPSLGPPGLRVGKRKGETGILTVCLPETNGRRRRGIQTLGRQDTSCPGVLARGACLRRAGRERQVAKRAPRAAGREGRSRSRGPLGAYGVGAEGCARGHEECWSLLVLRPVSGEERTAAGVVRPRRILDHSNRAGGRRKRRRRQTARRRAQFRPDKDRKLPRAQLSTLTT